MIQEQLDNISSQDATAYKTGAMLGSSDEKIWGVDKQLVIDWRIPQDVTRVMIFEKLEF